jgi:DNA-directed RNA polymerase subunit beta'
VKAPEYQPMAYFSSDVDEDPAAWLSNIHGTYSTDAVPGDAAEG